MKTSSLTWAAYSDSMSVLYEAGKLWKCLPSHSQIDLTYIDLIITCNHSQPWVVICLIPALHCFHRKITALPTYQCWCVCVQSCLSVELDGPMVKAVLPVMDVFLSHQASYFLISPYSGKTARLYIMLRERVRAVRSDCGDILLLCKAFVIIFTVLWQQYRTYYFYVTCAFSGATVMHKNIWTF